MGHSFGGAVAQVLLDRGLGSAGVAIDSAAVGFLVVPLSPIKASFPVLGNPFNRGTRCRSTRSSSTTRSPTP